MNPIDIEFEQAEMRQRWARRRRGEVVPDPEPLIRRKQLSRPCKCGGRLILGARGWCCRSCWGTDGFADKD